MLSHHTTQISPTSLGLPSNEFRNEDGVSTPKVLRIHPVDSGAGLISIEKQPFVFGREKGCEVHIQDDSASRRHSQIIQATASESDDGRTSSSPKKTWKPTITSRSIK